MTYTLDAVNAIQGWIASVQSAASQLPSDGASPSDFASTLQQIQSILGSPPGAAAQTPGANELDIDEAGADGLGTDALTGDGATVASPVIGADPSSGVTGSTIATDATQYLGVPYQWGGTTPSGFDCSGFVQYVYGQAGISLPRTSEEQAMAGTPVASLSQAQPGDLVFFAGSDGTASSPGHVGIYLGNGQMVDAPETGEDVSIQPVGDPVAIRRIVASVPTVASTTTNATTSASSVPSSLAPYFVNAAGQYGVPVQLLTSVASAESNFDSNAVSSAGAEGLMQLMPQTAATLGVNPFDPEQAIDGAAQLLSSYLTQFGSVPLALAAYNAGPGAVEQAGGIPPYPQTEAYVQQIMQSLGTGSSGGST